MIISCEDGLMNLTDVNGNLISQYQRFSDIRHASNGMIYVQREDGLWNFIDKNGNVILSNWYKVLGDFNDGYAYICNDKDKWNYIDKHGNLLCPNEWFDGVTSFIDDTAIVSKRVRNRLWWNHINTNGHLLLKDKWAIGLDFFNDGYSRVLQIINRKKNWNIIDKRGEYLLPQNDFAYIENIQHDYFIVQDKKGKYNFINKSGEILSSDLWFEHCSYVNKTPIGMVSKKRYYFDKNEMRHELFLYKKYD